MIVRLFIIAIVVSMVWQFSLEVNAPLRVLPPILKKNSETFTIGWVGDMVPSENDTYNNETFMFVSEYTQQPDFMMGNLEGTFAALERTSKCEYISNQCFAFRGSGTFADALKDAGFDFVSLVNNHSYDFGPEGLIDTEQELNRVGIPYISPTKPIASITAKGKSIGILGVSSTPPAQTITDYEFIRKNIEKLNEKHDIVILVFHGGAEGADKTVVPGEVEYSGSENRGDVQQVARTAIDAGADIVLGAGPHVLRKIETYKEKPIAYSLGNFVSGNKLSKRGLMSVSGIFVSTFSGTIPSFTKIIPMQILPDGRPAYDPSGVAHQLLSELSLQ